MCWLLFVTGTGTNACYMEKLDKVELWDGDHEEPHQVSEYRVHTLQLGRDLNVTLQKEYAAYPQPACATFVGDILCFPKLHAKWLQVYYSFDISNSVNPL